MSTHFHRLLGKFPNLEPIKPDHKGSYRAYCICSCDSHRCGLCTSDVQQLGANDKRSAALLVINFMNICQAGFELKDAYDEKQLHKAGISINHAGKSYEVLRIRKSDARLYFTQLPNKIRLVAKILAKTSDDLTTGESNEIHNRIFDALNAIAPPSSFDERVIPWPPKYNPTGLLENYI